jgi:predicted transposase YdaD
VRLYRRYRLPVEQVLVLVKPTSVPTPAVFEVGRTRHEYRVLRLWEQDPAPLLADEALLPLAVLARTADRPALVSTVAQRVRRIEPPSRQRDVASIVELLAGLVLDWEVLRTMFENSILEESSVYQAIIQKGREEGREEGRLIEARRLVLRALESRFGPVPDDVVSVVDQCPLTALDELMTVAATCPSVTAFAAAAAERVPPTIEI